MIASRPTHDIAQMVLATATNRATRKWAKGVIYANTEALLGPDSDRHASTTGHQPHRGQPSADR